MILFEYVFHSSLAVAMVSVFLTLKSLDTRFRKKKLDIFSLGCLLLRIGNY